MRCDDFSDGLTTLAEGGVDSPASHHVEGCSKCAARLAQLRSVVEAARLPGCDARAELIARVKGFVPRPEVAPRWVARLLFNGLATAGSRSSKETDFAVEVGTEEIAIPLHFTRKGDRWEIVGRAPTDGWSVRRHGEETPCGASGRFRLMVGSLDDAAFVLRGPDLVGSLEVPSVSELIQRGT